MIQIYTILLDSLRLLLARKLFWVVNIITFVVGMLYASIGFSETGFSVGFGLYSIDNALVGEDSDFAKLFYLLLFTNFINDWWFGFFAIVLALVSSCSLFPELMKEGSIDVMLSKPLSRLKLFIVKYLGALLFMAMPVLMLCTICFFSLGFRVGVWKAEVFLAVPLLMFVFSLVFSVAVLAGVLWRSTLFALISAILLWSFTFLIHISETMVYNFVYTLPKMGMEIDLATGQSAETGDAVPEFSEGGERTYALVRSLGAPFPKVRKSTLLLKRLVAFDDELGAFAGINLISIMIGQPPEGRELSASADFEKRMSIPYLLWSSALFEICVLGVAAWIFCRRDF